MAPLTRITARRQALLIDRWALLALTALLLGAQPGTAAAQAEGAEGVEAPADADGVEEGVPEAEPVIIVVEPDASDGGRHRITEIIIEFARENPAHPSQEDVLLGGISLLETDSGFIAPRQGIPSTDIQLADFPLLERPWFYDSALARIAPAVVIRLQQLGLIGVYAEPDREQFIVAEGRVLDRRGADDTSLRLIITTGRVTEVNTTGLGERLPEEETVNHPVHARIRDRSPIQPGDAAPEGTVDLLRRDEIDRYVHFLNRHPGRRVDVAVAATGEEPGAVALDYLVTENRPWLLYFQIANTGTESTDALRERFGFIHNQLTNSDDILSVEYLTSNFSDFHAFVGSYERPLFNNDRVRGRVYGSWYTYEASDVGQPNADFDGDGYSIGGEVIWNFHQINDHFFDAIFGARYESIEVDNNLAGIEGDEGFVIGYVGARYERTGDAASTRASATIEFSIDGADDSVDNLGRIDADDNWVTLNLGVSQSFYLEPLINPALSEDATLVHEVYLSARGQVAFDHRLIPNYQRVVGGLFTVRGYDESVVAGDSVFIGTAEYRFHLPRTFAPDPQPAVFFGTPFRFAPQYKYGPVDWDLILKAFVDVGVTSNSDRKSFEEDNTLVGVGVGAELALSRHFRARVDLGVALDDAETIGGRVENESGDVRVHFQVTLVF